MKSSRTLEKSIKEIIYQLYEDSTTRIFTEYDLEDIARIMKIVLKDCQNTHPGTNYNRVEDAIINTIYNHEVKFLTRAWHHDPTLLHNPKYIPKIMEPWKTRQPFYPFHGKETTLLPDNFRIMLTTHLNQTRNWSTITGENMDIYMEFIYKMNTNEKLIRGLKSIFWWTNLTTSLRDLMFIIQLIIMDCTFCFNEINSEKIVKNCFKMLRKKFHDRFKYIIEHHTHPSFPSATIIEKGLIKAIDHMDYVSGKIGAQEL